MITFRREAIALVVVAFYFFVLEQQTQSARLQWQLMQHLKRSRRRKLVLLHIALRKRRRAQRRAWSWPRNQFWFETLMGGGIVEDWWKEHFRISRRTFEYIVRIVGPALAKNNTRLRESIPVDKRIAVALWRLATGDTYRSTGLQFGVGRCTAMLIKHEFCTVIARRANEFIKFPVTAQEVTQGIRQFTNKSPFPQVVGAIDGSHIPLKSVPTNERIEYFNRKQAYSVVVQGVADASLKFIDVSTGFPGSIHDARIMRLSRVHREVSCGNWLSGPSRQIGGCEVRPLLVGDSAYPLSSWLMKPFKQTRTLTESQLRYNHALSQARVAVEQAFGILKGRWRCLYKPMEEKVTRVPTTIMACCSLHNICIDVVDPCDIVPVEDDGTDQGSLDGDVRLDATDIRESIVHHLS